MPSSPGGRVLGPRAEQCSFPRDPAVFPAAKSALIGNRAGASEGNRTPVTGLEGRTPTTRLHSQVMAGAQGAGAFPAPPIGEKKDEKPLSGWCRRRGSNPGPRLKKGGALPTELREHINPGQGTLDQPYRRMAPSAPRDRVWGSSARQGPEPWPGPSFRLPLKIQAN